MIGGSSWFAGPSPWYSASSATCGSIPALLICSYSEATCWNLQTCEVVHWGASDGLCVPHLRQGFRIQVRGRRHAGKGQLRQCGWWTDSRWELKSPKAHPRRWRRQSGAAREARCLWRSRHSCQKEAEKTLSLFSETPFPSRPLTRAWRELETWRKLQTSWRPLESRGLSDPRGLLGLGALGRGGPDHLVVRRVASRESSGSLEHPEAHLEELRRRAVGLRATARLGLLQVAVENRALRDPGLLSNDMPQATLRRMHKGRVCTALFWLLPACWGMHHLLQPLLP